MSTHLTIAHIVPGSGGTFYCQNCLRDLALVPALREHGHDAYILPLYLPLQDELPDAFKDDAVFFGAVNLYLSETYPLTKLIPRPFTKMLDGKAVLKAAAKRSGTTRAQGLEDMTISMLKGKEGNQKDALDELLTWIKNQPDLPDIFHISNALLIGLAPVLKETFDRPVFCSLQDEFGWIETMDPEYIDQVWSLMRECVPSVDAFCAVSSYYGELMTERLAVPQEKMHITPIGIPLTHFYPPETPKAPPLTLGFVSKLSPQYGLDRLIDAFIQLKSEDPFRELKLKATGGITDDVRGFLATMEDKLMRLGLWEDVEFVDDFQEAKRGEFLRSIDLLSVPVPGGEAFGTYQLEAMACGVPVVQPRAGAFTEVVESTGGGILYDPDAPRGLEDALRLLLNDPDQMRRLSLAGRKSVCDAYSIDAMAKTMSTLYSTITETDHDD